MVPLRLKLLMMAAILLLALPHTVHSQSNTGQDPANANALNTIFYFDSNSDCNGPKRELYGFQATIRGNDLTSTRLGPGSCLIRLQSSGQFDGTVLDIEVKSMNILECSTRVTIYDGDGTQLTLMSYDCYSNNNMNKRRLFSTGDTATFSMQRQNINSFNFDIEIKITPVRGGTNPGYENNFGSGYYFYKFPQTYIVTIIGGFYALILVICKIIFLVYCCRYRKMNKKWETQQLATIRTGAVYDTKSQMSSAWNQSMEMKQVPKPASQYSDSKPHSRTVARSEDTDSVDVFQKKRLVEADKSKAKPRYTRNASFTEDDPDHFVERIITSRVKSSNTRGKMPPSYQDAVSDDESSSDYSTGEESRSTSTSSVRKRPPSSEAERSSLTQSESVSESDSDHSDHAAKAKREKRRAPHKSKKKYSNENAPSAARSNHQQKPRSQPVQPQMQQVPYGAYQDGQFVPVMVGLNQFQPGAIPCAPYPEPSYTDQQAAPRSQIQPTDPPVYSYLVRRGYAPMDAHSSSAGSTTGGRHTQEPDLRLDSGVEYMNR